MHPDAQPWWRQAEADLETAKDSRGAGHFEWACFQALQAAEKGLKAFLLDRGHGKQQVRDFSHSVHGPGSALEASQGYEPSFASLDSQASLLNLYSIAPRYPDTPPHLGVAPVDHYTFSEAESCVAAAQIILDFVRPLVP